MTIKTITILTIILLGITMFSCCKDKNIDNHTSYHYLYESIKPYKFKTGSYWVFKNDTTGALDSIVVTSTENDFYWSPPPVHGQPGAKHEYYKINLQNLTTSETYNYYLTSYYIKQNGGGDYGQYGQPIFMADSDIGTEFNGMEIVDKLPTITINSNSFNNVVKVKITAVNQYQPEFDYDTYLYYTDTVGLIKKETDLGSSNIESWSLKKWNVIK